MDDTLPHDHPTSTMFPIFSLIPPFVMHTYICRLLPNMFKRINKYRSFTQNTIIFVFNKSHKTLQ